MRSMTPRKKKTKSFEAILKPQITDMDLVNNWHGQKPLTLPSVRVERKGQEIILKSTKTMKPGACQVNLDKVQKDITKVLVTEEQIATRIEELAREIEKKYEGKDLLLSCPCLLKSRD